MQALAVVFDEPERLSVRQVQITAPEADDIVVDVAWSGVSTGTERLLWSGRMPPFPGMGYPLVPGYESTGEVVEAGPGSGLRPGDRVFVPGARCFSEVRGLFGGAAATIVSPASRALKIDPGLNDQGALLALAATAFHALAAPHAVLPDLIVGHGVLGRLLARLSVALGQPDVTVWETGPERRRGALGYRVIDPETDPRRDYRAIYDASGDAGLLDALIGRLAPGGEIVLAGFYAAPLSFSFPQAFIKEARLRVAAEWRRQDLETVNRLVESGRLSLAGLITHHARALNADNAYRVAFGAPDCLKMVLDWSRI